MTKFYDFDELEKDIPQEVKQRAKKKAQEMAFALSLAEIRNELGITQEELAKRLNIKQSAVSKLEKREGISLSKLSELIEAMGGEVEINVKFPKKKFALKSKMAV